MYAARTIAALTPPSAAPAAPIVRQGSGSAS